MRAALDHHTRLKPTTLLLLDELLGDAPLPEGDQALWVATNCMDKDADRAWCVDQCRVSVEPYEVLVDFHFFSGGRVPYRTVLTAESEGYVPQVRRLANTPLPGPEEDCPENGLLWDLWKLILVPSPFRVFTTIADERQYPVVRAHFGTVLGRYADVPHDGSPFALVCFDPDGTPAAAVRVATWGAGAWKARPNEAARVLRGGS